MKKLLFVISIFASAPLIAQIDLVSTQDGKAYTINQSTGEIAFLDNGVSSIVEIRSDLKEYLKEVANDPETNGEVSEFSESILLKFYNIRRVGEFWIEDVKK